MFKATLLFLLTLSSAVAIGQKSDSFSLYFDLNSCSPNNLSEIQFPAIDSTVTVHVNILGYTDPSGSAAYNLTLSQCRADKVAELLPKLWGDKTKIVSAKGKGELLNANEDEIHEKSRRVDVSYTLVASEPIPATESKPKTVEPKVEEEVQYAQEELITIDTSTTGQIVLQGLSFIPGRHFPLPESRPVLEKLLKTMQTNQALEIEIQGFICCDYTVEDGLDNDTGEPLLSHNRAKYVYEFLVEKGIDENRMRYKGYGNTRPKVFPEQSREDQQKNRRVEIEILKQ